MSAVQREARVRAAHRVLNDAGYPVPPGLLTKALRAADEIPIPNASDACATCNHERRQHIYHEGACRRPGFTCPKGCTGFRDRQDPSSLGSGDTPE